MAGTSDLFFISDGFGGKNKPGNSKPRFGPHSTIIFAAMYSLIKRLLFLMPPERAHYFTMGMLRIVLRIPVLGNVFRSVGQTSRSQQVMGLIFPNRLGMAAGFDKNAQWLKELHALGFGFVEIGTVTPRPQPGNPKPRLFRIPADAALINRMGFNNDGADAVAKRLRDFRKETKIPLIVGGNIGKNKDTPNEEAASDYVAVFEKLYPYVDYFVINVSSPNTPNLRALQERSALELIIRSLKDREREIMGQGIKGPKPLLLKIAPDLSDEAIAEITDMAATEGLTGIVATNTTIERNLSISADKIREIGAGGLSGRPVRARSTEVIRRIREQNSELVLIGVGGIESADSARQKMEAGADLVQIYTGFIYRGPKLVKEIGSI